MNIAGSNNNSMFFRFSVSQQRNENELSISSQGFAARRNSVNNLVASHTRSAEELEEYIEYLLEKFPVVHNRSPLDRSIELTRCSEEILAIKERIQDHKERADHFREMDLEIGGELAEYEYMVTERDREEKLESIVQFMEETNDLEAVVALLESLYEEYQQEQYATNSESLQRYMQQAKMSQQGQRLTVRTDDINIQRVLHNANSSAIGHTPRTELPEIQLSRADQELLQSMTLDSIDT